MTVEREECERAVWYISTLENADRLFCEAAHETQSFTGFELKLDGCDFSVVSKRYATLKEAVQEARNILNHDDKTCLLSLRMFFSLANRQCNARALNSARHECKVCKHDFLKRSLDRCSYVEPTSIMFSCYSNAQIAQNARTSQDHFSRIAQYRQGDGTIYAATAIQKMPDPAGQSLLKQAMRVEKGLDPNTVPNNFHQRFTVYNEERYALIPPNARADRQPEAYRWPWGRQNNRLNLRQANARPFDCVEDEFDIDLRQNAGFEDVHYSGKQTKEEFFSAIAARNGVDKFSIVAALKSS